MDDKPVSAADDGQFLGTLRELCAELRHVRGRVDAFRGALVALSQDPKDPRKADALKAKRTLQHALEVNRPQIEALIASLAAEARRRAGIADYWGDQVAQIENLCEEASYLLDEGLGSANHLPAPDAMSEVLSRIDEALLTGAYVTVPPRLNQYLKNYRNGQVLRFDKTFSPELLPDHVGKVLAYLGDQPRCVTGIVDVEAKTVTKVSPERWRRALTFEILAALVALCLLVPPWLASVSWTKSLFATQTRGRLVGAIVVTFLGAIAHLLVGAVKQVRTSIADDDSRRFVSFDNWAVWAAAHEVDLAIAIVTVGVVAGYFAGGMGEHDAVKLLAVGYSADSVVEIIRPKFEAAMKKRAAEVVGT